jgi:hypothetical protein
LEKERNAVWNGLSQAQRRELVRTTIHPAIAAADSVRRDEKARTTRSLRSVGILKRDGYSIEKLVFSPEVGIHLPGLAFVPEEPSGHATLYLHGESMQADAGRGGPIENLVKHGQIVLAAELRGIGETETGHDKRDYGYGKFGRDSQEVFLAYLIGRSYVGMRADDALGWSKILASYRTDGARKHQLHLAGVGEAAIPALHAAALAPDRFISIHLRHMIPSWRVVVRTPDSHNQLVNVVHGALRHYDLPDLIELVGSHKVTLDRPVDAMGRVISQ